MTKIKYPLNKYRQIPISKVFLVHGAAEFHSTCVVDSLTLGFVRICPLGVEDVEAAGYR